MKQSMLVASFNSMTWLICFRNWVPKSFPFELLKCQGRKWLMMGTEGLVQCFEQDPRPAAGRNPHYYWTQLPARPEVGLCWKLSTAQFLQATLLGQLWCHRLSWRLLNASDPALHAALWVVSEPGAFRAEKLSRKRFPGIWPLLFKSSLLDLAAIFRAASLFLLTIKVFQKLRPRASRWYSQWRQLVSG